MAILVNNEVVFDLCNLPSDIESICEDSEECKAYQAKHNSLWSLIVVPFVSLFVIGQNQQGDQ